MRAPFHDAERGATTGRCRSRPPLAGDVYRRLPFAPLRFFPADDFEPPLRLVPCDVFFVALDLLDDLLLDFRAEDFPPLFFDPRVFAREDLLPADFLATELPRAGLDFFAPADLEAGRLRPLDDFEPREDFFAPDFLPPLFLEDDFPEPIPVARFAAPAA